MVVVVVLFWKRAEVSQMCMSTSAVQIGRGALDDKELFVIEGSENWRSTPDNLEEREKCGKTARSPFIAAITN